MAEYWRFLRYGLPPNGGGLRDQPAGWVESGEYLHRIYTAFSAYRQCEAGHAAAWITAHPHEWDIIKYVRGLENG